MAHLLAALGLGNHPLLPDKYPHSDVAPLPTVAVRKCSSTKLLEFANEDKRVREDVFIDILEAHFAPPAGEAPDLLFMPTSCGWADPALHDAKTLGPQRVMLAAGPSKCHALPGQTAANDGQTTGADSPRPLWETHKSPEGYTYYYNTTTGETTWDQPEEYAGVS